MTINDFLEPEYQQQPHKHNSLFRTFFKGFGLLVTYEIIEEFLEEAISWAITTAIAKTLSFLIVVVLTQTVKISAKAIAKGLTVAIKPWIKQQIYKPGNDKVMGLIKFINKICHTNIQLPNDSKDVPLGEEETKINEGGNIKMSDEKKSSKFVAFVNFVKCNKKSILSTATSLVASLGSGTLVQTWCANSGIPGLYTYLIAAVCAVVMFGLTELGVSARGWETLAKFTVRSAEDKALKEAKKTQSDAAKIANDTLKQAKKLAKRQAKDNAKVEAEAKAREYLNQHPELLNK